MNSSYRVLAVPFALTSLMLVDGCKDPEPRPITNTDLLSGDWKLTEVFGYEADPDYSILFKFEKSGNFQQCEEYDTYSYCYDGTWAWEDSTEKKINITSDGETFSIDVTLLDEDNLQGNFVYGTYDFGQIKFVKVN